MPKDKTAKALRIYEYVDNDGVVFWSFTRLAGFSVRRLTLTDHMGQHYRKHIQDVHQMAFQRDILDRED